MQKIRPNKHTWYDWLIIYIVFKQAVYRRGKKLNKSKTQKQSEEEHDYYYYQKKKISNL